MVDGRDCIMLDHIVDSAGTWCNAAVALKGRLALRRWLHMSRTASSPVVQSPVSTIRPSPAWSPPTSIAATPEVLGAKRVEQISVAPLLAEAVIRISQERSVSSLFN